VKQYLSLAASVLALSLPLVAAGQDPAIPADTEIVMTASGLKYSVLKPGDGVGKPRTGDVVKVHYTGWTPDGKKFDSSHDRNEFFYVELGRGKVIKGWDEGIALMSMGERIKLTIPPELGYGPKGFPPKIPANSTLIFEVELVDFAWVFQALAPDAKKTTASGIGYQIVKAGSGTSPKVADVVEFRYAAWKPDGELQEFSEFFQQSRGMPTSKNLCVPIAEVRSAFLQEALTLTPAGGSTRIEVPASVCWPDRLPPGVKADSVISWHIEVTKILEVPQFVMPDPAKLVKTPSGLAYEVIKEGTGKQPGPASRVKVHYAGWLADGRPFDSSFGRGEPATFAIGQVVKGWIEGLQLMKEGAIYRFVVPPELGYGAAGSPPAIPANATLVFYLELISIAG